MRRFLALLLVALSAAGMVAPEASASAPLATYVVTFDGPPSADEVDMLSAIARSVHPFEHVPAAVVVIDPTDVTFLAQLPGVLGVTANLPLHRQLNHSTRAIHADRVWNELGVTGDGIGIAVIDTGVDGTHADLCAAPQFCHGTPVKTVQNVKFIGRQDVAVDPVLVLEDQINTDTSSGHGTHVSGIATGLGVSSSEPGKYRGVASGAKLIGLGTGELLETTNVLAAYDWLIENKDDPRYNIKVVNNSWGPDKGTPFNPDDPVQRAIDAAHDAGITVVFSAGNAGPATDSLNAFSVNPDAISVAAGTNEGHIAVFSSRGIPGNEFWHPTITAPGWSVASTRASTGFVSDANDTPNPSDPILPPDTAYYASGSGTSMAAPHITGMVALMQEAAFDARGTYLTPDQVKNIVQNTAVSRDSARGPGGLPNYQRYTMGAGYADAFAAVQAATAGTGTQPYDDGVTYDVRGFTGTVGPAVVTPLQSFETTYSVAPGALSLNVMIDWSVVANDLEIDLYRPDGTQHSTTFLRLDPAAEPNGYSSTFSNVPNERTTVVAPEPGLWRAVIRGSLSATDTANGVWSASYADGTALPPAQQAASIVLAPATSTSLTGVDVKLTATVRDAGGQPVPNAPVTWTTAGAGSLVLSESMTNAAGVARATARSAAPGTQTVTAANATGSSSALITWLGATLPPLPPSGASTPGKVSGGGWINDPNKRTFAVNAQYHAGATAPSGNLRFDDKQGTSVKEESVTRLVITGNRAVIYGTATVNGSSGYKFQVEVVDNGEPGRNDTFRLTLTKTTNPLYSYESDGTLTGGNLQVKP